MTEEELKTIEEQAREAMMESVSPFGESKKDALFSVPKSLQSRLPTEEELAKKYKDNKTTGTYALAEYITHKYNVITIGEHDREVYVYQDGYYRLAENLVIYPEIQRILRDQVNKNAKTETLHKIQDMTAKPRSIFNSAPLCKIPLADGVYDYETSNFGPHFSDYHFTYQFPIKYNQMADCPKISAFLDQILTPEQRLTIEEWLGFYFVRNYMFKKAMIIVGDTDTGKTTLLEVITYLLGIDNIAAVSLHQMSGDKFSAAHLFGKHGNIVDELSARDITDTGSFKKATGGGNITGEYKYGNQFGFINFSKFTFTCNQIPDVSNDVNDNAFYNRWIVIRLEKIIEKKIPDFIKILLTEEERSGLFNLAMKGLKRLIKQGRFTYNLTPEETKVEMLRSGSTLAMFVTEMVEPCEGYEISKDAFYEEYTKFCVDKGISTDTKEYVGRRLTGYASYMSDGHIAGLTKTGKPSQVRGWRGGKIKEIEQDDFKDFETPSN